MTDSSGTSASLEDEAGADRRTQTARLTDAIDELRTLINVFDETSPRDMTAEFYIHAFNEYDLAVRALPDAFDDIR
jgi:hypothetical protein